MAKIFIKPAVAGYVIRHPEKLSHIIKQEGEWVRNNRDWKRMLLQGDVVIAEPPIAKAKDEKPAVKQKEKNMEEKVSA